MNVFGDMLTGFAVAFAILLGISLFIWWMIRGLVLWYFRIDEIVGLLEQIERNTRSSSKNVNFQTGSKEAYKETIDKTVAHVSSSIDLPSKPASSSGRKCRDCGAELSRNAEFCAKCLAPVR